MEQLSRPLPRAIACRTKKEIVLRGENVPPNAVVFLSREEAEARFKAGEISFSVDFNDGFPTHVERR